MTTCFILAAGEAERHNGGNKPLLEVNGETLLDRTMRLLDNHDCETYIVTHRDDLKHQKAAIFSPKSRRWITETILYTRELWANPGSRTVVLLGDVFYSELALDMVFRHDFVSNSGIHAFGNGCNVHALKWGASWNEWVENELAIKISKTAKRTNSHGAGKLWSWLEASKIGLIDFEDETTDFDSPQEHQRFIAKYGNRSTRSTG